MTLSVVIGSSGSGKTTFLEEVHNYHDHCIYIRQHHMMRPYIVVQKIPNFNPAKLPFWRIYEKEDKAEFIQVGGTLGGSFIPGFSGGQRKLLLFELISQRIEGHTGLLIVLDEPFCGVTDDFMPFISRRLQELQRQHNVIVVTNDHIEKIKNIADNVICISAADRFVVTINDRKEVDRTKAIIAIATGDNYIHKNSQADVKFFFDVEVIGNKRLHEIALFAVVNFTLYMVTYWNSATASAPLVLLSGSIVAFFILNPYLLSLVEWRNSMLEEAEALIHVSRDGNIGLKILLTLSIILILSVIEFVAVNIVIGGLFWEAKFWIAMLCDNASLTLPLALLGLYTRLPFQTVQIVGSMPYMCMIFLSTTFSPGAGLPVLKDLRYVFTRFYFWCMVPGLQDQMEGCPSESFVIFYLVLSAFCWGFIFFCAILLLRVVAVHKTTANRAKLAQIMKDTEFKDLQAELYLARENTGDV